MATDWPCEWWLSILQVAAVLAEDTVTETVKAVTRGALETDDSWQDRVCTPSSQLAKQTMPRLSAGWGRGVFVACVAAWFMSFSKLARFLQKLDSPDYSEGGAVMRVLLPAVAFALGPTLIMIDLAIVSSLWCVPQPLHLGCAVPLAQVPTDTRATPRQRHANEPHQRARSRL